MRGSGTGPKVSTLPSRLSGHLYPTEPVDRKLSKIETLRLASSYISHLANVLMLGDGSEEGQPCLTAVYSAQGGRRCEATPNHMYILPQQPKKRGKNFEIAEALFQSPECCLKRTPCLSIHARRKYPQFYVGQMIGCAIKSVQKYR